MLDWVACMACTAPGHPFAAHLLVYLLATHAASVQAPPPPEVTISQVPFGLHLSSLQVSLLSSFVDCPCIYFDSHFFNTNMYIPGDCVYNVYNLRSHLNATAANLTTALSMPYCRDT